MNFSTNNDSTEYNVNDQSTPNVMEGFDTPDLATLNQQQREKAREVLRKHNALSDNYQLGFIGALLGGLVGAIPWVFVSSWGWFVAWLGYVIAIAAAKGYDLMRVKPSMMKMWFVAISVVISVFVGQIASDLLIIAYDPEYSPYVWEFFEYMMENFGEYLSVSGFNLFLGLVFAVWGGFTVFKQIKAETSLIEEYKRKYPTEDISE